MAADPPPLKPGQRVIQPGDPDYPEYSVTFDGDIVVDGTVHTKPVFVRGTHSFRLAPLPANVEIKVALKHFPSNPGVPNLIFEIKRTTPKKP